MPGTASSARTQTGRSEQPFGGVTIDHVAVAVPRWSDAWPRYVGQLGGRWYAGGANVGFAPCQLRFANDARLELLAPHEPHANPFLQRYLDRHGPGPHHVTFKVGDLTSVLEAMAGAGWEPVQVDRSDPEWQEAYVHPRQASGIVVQVAQAAGTWESPPPPELPAPAPAPWWLLRATHVVADLDAALRLFCGLLGGRPRRAPATGAGLAAVDLAWEGPLTLRLVGPADPTAPPPALRSWLGSRPGRLHHLAFREPVPAGASGSPPFLAVGDADDLGAGTADGLVVDRTDDLAAGTAALGVLPEDGHWVTVPPERNLGTRLVLLRTSP